MDNKRLDFIPEPRHVHPDPLTAGEVGELDLVNIQHPRHAVTQQRGDQGTQEGRREGGDYDGDALEVVERQVLSSEQEKGIEENSSALIDLLESERILYEGLV